MIPRTLISGGSSHPICSALEHRLHWCKIGYAPCRTNDFSESTISDRNFFLVPLVGKYHVPWPSNLSDWLHASIVGLLVHGGYLSGVLVAIKGIFPASLAALIVGIQLLLTGILGGPLLGESLTRKKWGASLRICGKLYQKNYLKKIPLE